MGAIASAVVAAYALVFLSHQESIAQQQVKATYLANLYTKQVESIAALQAAFNEFDHTAYSVKAMAAVLDPVSDVPAFQSELKALQGAPFTKLNEVNIKRNSVTLITPKSFSAAVLDLDITYSGYEATIVTFLQGPSTEQASKQFSEQLRKIVDDIERKSNFVWGCASKILATGRPIDESTMSECAGGGSI
jgi:hypothetical protein